MTTPTPVKQKGRKATGKARPAQPRPAVAPPKAKPGRKAGPANKAASTRKIAGTASQRSKTAKILELLKRRSGATLKELMKATGWQPHSVRGFLSGTLKKKMGTAVESFKSGDGERTYRIAFK